MLKVPADYDRNVFINCPFDAAYLSLFNAIVFAVHDSGFRPRCALEASDAGQFRLEKIMKIISECKYSVHDISRTEIDPHTATGKNDIPSGSQISRRYEIFGKVLPYLCKDLKLDLKDLSFVDFSYLVVFWLQKTEGFRARVSG